MGAFVFARVRAARSVLLIPDAGLTVVTFPQESWQYGFGSTTISTVSAGLAGAESNRHRGLT